MLSSVLCVLMLATTSLCSENPEPAVQTEASAATEPVTNMEATETGPNAETTENTEEITDTCPFPLETKVALFGLNNVEHNNRVGDVIGMEGTRVSVRVNAERVMNLKPENIRPLGHGNNDLVITFFNVWTNEMESRLLIDADNSGYVYQLEVWNGNGLINTRMNWYMFYPWGKSTVQGEVVYGGFHSQLQKCPVETMRNYEALRGMFEALPDAEWVEWDVSAIQTKVRGTVFGLPNPTQMIHFDHETEQTPGNNGKVFRATSIDSEMLFGRH